VEQRSSKKTNCKTTATGCTSAAAEYKEAIQSIYHRVLVQDVHMLALHGGAGLPMALIRRDYLIPQLRQLTKKVTSGCFGCMKFQANAFGRLPPGKLPIDCTMVAIPFHVLGVDYAGLIL